jgi:hypothetical protein
LQWILASTDGDSMKHFLFSFLVLFITLLCGVTVGL